MDLAQQIHRPPPRGFAPRFGEARRSLGEGGSEDQMMRRFVVVILLAVGALASVPVIAHHSAAATYFEDKSQTIEGNLVQFIYRNPHAFVYVEAPDPATGQPARWAVEWTSGNALNGLGITRETLKAGDHVVVTGSPGRHAAEHRLRMRRIVRAKDGWKWEGNFQ